MEWKPLQNVIHSIWRRRRDYDKTSIGSSDGKLDEKPQYKGKKIDPNSDYSLGGYETNEGEPGSGRAIFNTRSGLKQLSPGYGMRGSRGGRTVFV